MDQQNRNLILAVVLSALVFVVWSVIFPPPATAPSPDPASQAAADTPASVAAPDAGEPGAAAASAAEDAGLGEPQAPAARVAIDTPALTGSLSLRGARLDDLALRGYTSTLGGDDLVHLLTPEGSPYPYFAIAAFTAGAGVAADAVPGATTPWTLVSGGPAPEADPEALADGETPAETVASLTPATPVVLEWDNGAGLVFTRTIAVDESYMFTITDRVANAGAAAATLTPYAFVVRDGREATTSNYILHEGIVRMSDGELQEIKYNNIPDLDPAANGTAQDSLEVAADGWIGFTDKYWMTTIIPTEGEAFTSVAAYLPATEAFQAIARRAPLTVAPGTDAEVETRVFAGAKEIEVLRAYENDPGALAQLFGSEADPSRPRIHGFIESIDWGIFWFLTKPIFQLLHTLHEVIGNMGWAIIALTLVIKALVFPLARKSYISMARMKELQPEMEKLKEKTGDDRMALQQGMMKLYKDNKVNPASGCLPVIIQIPIFFALYKCIFITIELYHAPWILWIRDLSAPDPSSILNLFGLLPYATPGPGSLLHIVSLGVLPILLGISMWMQQKLNPAPPDPTQRMVFAWMPWIFMFMLGTFASGLVLYWIANNTITFTQQYLIMRSHGSRPDIFGNIRESLKRAPKGNAATVPPADTPRKGK